jgi:hypothetical protein
VRIVAILGVAFSTLPACLGGQSQDDVTSQIWVDYNPSWQASPTLEVYGDIGVRTELASDRWWRFAVRPNTRYRWHGVELMGGARKLLYGEPDYRESVFSARTLYRRLRSDEQPKVSNVLIVSA